MDADKELIRWLDPYLDHRERDVLVEVCGRLTWHYRTEHRYVRVQTFWPARPSFEIDPGGLASQTYHTVGDFLEETTGIQVSIAGERETNRYRDELPGWILAELRALVRDVLPQFREQHPEAAAELEGSISPRKLAAGFPAWEQIAMREEIERFLLERTERIAEKFETMPMTVALQRGDKIARELEKAKQDAAQDWDIELRAMQQRAGKFAQTNYWPVVVAEYVARFGENPPATITLEEWPKLQEALDHCGLTPSEIRMLPMALPGMNSYAAEHLYERYIRIAEAEEALPVGGSEE